MAMLTVWSMPSPCWLRLRQTWSALGDVRHPCDMDTGRLPPGTLVSFAGP